MRRALRALVCAAALVVVAAPAFAARVVQVRVGKHPTFSRVVFELDSHAGYRVETRGVSPDGGKVLAVTLDASSPDRQIISKSLGVGSVKVEEVDGKAVALVTLRESDLTMKEMILSNPPRIVLDFERAQAAAPAPKPAPKVAQAAPAPAPKPAPAAKPEPVAKAEPKPAAKPAAAPQVVAPITPEPAEVAKAEAKPASRPAPEPAPAPAVEPEARPEPRVARAEPTQPAPKPIAKPIDDMVEAAAQGDPAARRAMTPGVHKREGEPGGESADDAVREMESAVAGTREAQPGVAPMDEAVARAEPGPAARPVAPPAKTAEPAAKPSVAPASSPEALDPTLIAAIAGGVLLVAIVAFVLLRRRSIPKDLDVTSMTPLDEDDDVVDAPRGVNEAGEGTLEGRIPNGGFEMTEPVAAAAAASDDSTEQVASPGAGAYSLSEVSAGARDDDPSAGLFDDDDSEGEKAMDTERSDLPADREGFDPAATTIGSVGGNDISAMVQQLMARVDALEKNLEEANDARDRLERQVAAQSEELRVQRAAIARTQRALRSLNRTDEEQATEPALRDPS